jgi:hypothetical protein
MIALVRQVGVRGGVQRKALNVWMNTDIFVGENNKADLAGRESRKKGTTNQGRGAKSLTWAGTGTKWNGCIWAILVFILKFWSPLV